MNTLSLQLRLFFILLRHTDYISLEDLAQDLGCSKNTVLKRVEDAKYLIANNRDIFIEVNKTRGCRAVGDREKFWNVIKTLRRKNRLYVTWKNREERQLLILLELLSNPMRISKLSVLGGATNVVAATVLEDIKQLNRVLSPASIMSHPGSGTKIVGNTAVVHSKTMEYCYKVLSPVNILLLARGDKTLVHYEICPCASEIFLNMIREKINISRIIESIHAWEAHTHNILHDVAFANLFVYLIITQLRSISHLYLEADEYAHISSLHAETLLPHNVRREEIRLLQYFLLGLEENILYTNHHSIEKEIHALETAHRKIIECVKKHANSTRGNIEHHVMKSLLLLKYRKENSLRYWEERIQEPYQGRLIHNHMLIHALDTVCDESHFLETDVLLCILDPLLKEETIPSIEVTLFCVAGISTARILKKMIERHCPKLRIRKICSFRNCSHEDLCVPTVLSTTKSDILPSHAIIVNPFFDEYKWNEVQEQIFQRVRGCADESVYTDS